MTAYDESNLADAQTATSEASMVNDPRAEAVLSNFYLTSLMNNILGRNMDQGLNGIIAEMDRIKRTVAGLEKALGGSDFEAVRAMLSQLNFNVLSFSHVAGLHADYEFRNHLAVMQQCFDATEEAAQKTFEHYGEMGLNVNTLHAQGAQDASFFVTVVNGNQTITDADGKTTEYFHGDILHSVNNERLVVPAASAQHAAQLGFTAVAEDSDEATLRDNVQARAEEMKTH